MKYNPEIKQLQLIQSIKRKQTQKHITYYQHNKRKMYLFVRIHERGLLTKKAVLDKKSKNNKVVDLLICPKKSKK